MYDPVTHAYDTVTPHVFGQVAREVAALSEARDTLCLLCKLNRQP